jgi:hypothetical protein
MNDPTSTFGQSRRRGAVATKRGVMATATRRCTGVLALVLLFLTIGIGGMPGHESGKRASLTLEAGLFDHGLALPTLGEPASANTLAGANQELVDECGCYEGALSTRARHKTH